MTPLPSAIHARALRRQYRRGVRTGFSRIVAVDGIDLDVAAGSVHGLLGPNGAGKTTTIHMLLGLVRPTSGDVALFGASPRTTSVRERIGYVPEKFELPGFLTARTFLDLHARLAGLTGAERTTAVDRSLERVGLADRSNDQVATFSKGMQQRLAIGQAIIGAPRLVVFDEPTSALDPIGRRDVRDLILELRDAGTTVLLNSHLLAEVEQVCDDVTILEHGRVVATAPMADARRERARVGVHLRVADAPPELLDALRDLVHDVYVDDAASGPGVADLHGTLATAEDAAYLAQLVVTGGARLLELRTQRESLEQIFLRTVGVDIQEAAA